MAATNTAQNQAQTKTISRYHFNTMFENGINPIIRQETPESYRFVNDALAKEINIIFPDETFIIYPGKGGTQVEEFGYIKADTVILIGVPSIEIARISCRNLIFFGTGSVEIHGGDIGRVMGLTAFATLSNLTVKDGIYAIAGSVSMDHVMADEIVLASNVFQKDGNTDYNLHLCLMDLDHIRVDDQTYQFHDKTDFMDAQLVDPKIMLHFSQYITRMLDEADEDKIDTAPIMEAFMRQNWYQWVPINWWLDPSLMPEHTAGQAYAYGKKLLKLDDGIEYTLEDEDESETIFGFIKKKVDQACDAITKFFEGSKEEEETPSEESDTKDDVTAEQLAEDEEHPDNEEDPDEADHEESEEAKKEEPETPSTPVGMPQMTTAQTEDQATGTNHRGLVDGNADFNFKMDPTEGAFDTPDPFKK